MGVSERLPGYRKPVPSVKNLAASVPAASRSAQPASVKLDASSNSLAKLQLCAREPSCDIVATAQLQDPGGGEERTHCEEFEFADLRFIKSSRMSKRRLAFLLQVQVLLQHL